MIGLASAAFALQVQLRAEPPVLSQGQAGSVSLVITSDGRADPGAQSGRPPRLPTDRGLSAEFAGDAHEFHTVNGRIARVVRFEYRLTALEVGTWTIGPIDLPLTDGTIAHTEPIQVVVTDRSAVKSAGPPPEFEVDVSFDDTSLWEGQLVVLKAALRTRYGDLQVDWLSPSWNGLQRPQQGASSKSSYVVVDPDLGTIAVHEMRVPLVAVATGTREQGSLIAEISRAGDFGSFFRRFRGISERIASDPIRLEVKPLPPAVPGFAGVVGDVEVSSVVDAEGQVAVGQSVEWTVTVTGSGALDAFELPAYAPGNSLVYDKGVERTAALKGDRGVAPWSQPGEFISQAVFRRVLVPTESGRLELPPVTFATFSPIRGEYVTHTVELPALDVVPGADLTTRVERYGTTDGAAEASLQPVDVRPLYTWGRATVPSLAPWLPAMLGLAAAPGLALLARLGAGRAAEELARRRAPRSADPGRASFVLEHLPEGGDARWAAYDSVLRRLEAEPGALPHAEAIRALRVRLGRFRFGDGRPDATFESDVRALVAEIEG